ncbi:MAG: hypothetical protein IKI50_01470 [Clostridia bacterium]|nr:hypothetical protein [Clostridia bacterium]
MNKRMTLHRRPRLNRKGVAIEMALSTMMIVFAMLAVIVSIAYYSRMHSNRQMVALQQAALVDQVGEQFCEAVDVAGKHDTQPVFTYEDANFYATLTQGDGEQYTMTLRRLKDDEPVLTVTVLIDGDGYRLLRWNRTL